MDKPHARRRTGREEKVAIARRWQSSGQKQEDFARQEGISSRTLRDYVKLVPGPRWDRQLRSAVEHAADALAVILETLDRSPPPVEPSPPQPAVSPAAPSAPPAPTTPAPRPPTPKPLAAAPTLTGAFRFLGKP
jgi:hypothetical protein